MADPHQNDSTTLASSPPALPHNRRDVLEETYLQSCKEANLWFLICLITAIVGFIVTIIVDILIAFHLISRGITSTTTIQTGVGIIMNSLQIGAFRYISKQKTNANSRVDSYSNKIHEEHMAKEIIDIVLANMPEGQERSKFLTEVMAQVFFHSPEQQKAQQRLPVPGFTRRKGT